MIDRGLLAMKRRAFILLASLWRTSTGETVSDAIVWAKNPAITITQDGTRVFVDIAHLHADLVLVNGTGGLRFAPKELVRIWQALRKYAR